MWYGLLTLLRVLYRHNSTYGLLPPGCVLLEKGAAPKRLGPTAKPGKLWYGREGCMVTHHMF
jgi:hypothetical protein